MKMELELTESELLTIQILSNMRSLTARGNNVKDAKMSNSKGSEIDFDGLIGEYAFCKLNNIFLDFIPSPRSGSYDCYWKNKRIDIKTTRYTNGRLLVTLKKNVDVDIYILCVINNDTAIFKGWCLSDEIYKKENVIDLGHGKGYAPPQEKLHIFPS